MQQKWLISDNEFVHYACSMEHYEMLIENGIISNQAAKDIFNLIRFDCVENFKCPNCHTVGDPYILKNEQYKCKKCRFKYSTFSGTYLSNCNLSFAQVYRACYLIGGLGVTNSCAIARDLCITQKSAYKFLTKIRNTRKIVEKERQFTTGTELLVFKDTGQLIDLLLTSKHLTIKNKTK